MQCINKLFCLNFLIVNFFSYSMESSKQKEKFIFTVCENKNKEFALLEIDVNVIKLMQEDLKRNSRNRETISLSMLITHNYLFQINLNYKGFIVYDLYDTHYYIPIIKIKENCQGKGLGHFLLKESLKKIFTETSITHITLMPSGLYRKNYDQDQEEYEAGLIKFYQKCFFKKNYDNDGMSLNKDDFY